MKSILVLVLFLQLFMVPAGTNASAYSAELKQRLSKALSDMPADYQPRTEHFCDNKLPCYTNRLILEASPYLLQHAHNPVNWYAWGEEALARAKRENKPIFLSIGYAACHWCHVMEKESFDNKAIAKILNTHFISIKVDREQRPDIDEFYGHAVMIFQGQQGWPMSVFLTPDARPFGGGGYYSRNEFEALLLKMSDDWSNRRQAVVLKSDQILADIKGMSANQDNALVFNDGLRKKALKSLYSIVDNYNGGFGEGSKFPREPWLFLLLDDSYSKAPGDVSAQALFNTLNHMARGGIYDQLAGGFHRYSTDPYWKIPHFEKMLYNQALLIQIYLRANNIKPDVRYTRVAQQTADFLLSEMRDVNGAFYSAFDADSAASEGQFYLWTLKEWMQLLGKFDGELAAEIFDVDEYGETENGENILYIATTLNEYMDEHAEDKKISLAKLKQRMARITKKLWAARELREKPALDKKIIMGWNGLAITALAETAQQLNKPDYLAAATGAADFIWRELQGEGYFNRVYYAGKKSQPAQLADYAFYLQALITLYDISESRLWLARAEVLTKMMLKLFEDTENGGFYNVRLDKKSPLPSRVKTAFDRTLVAGNAVAAHMLIRLARRTGNNDYLKSANTLFQAFVADVEEVPSAFSGLLLAFNELQQGEKDLPVFTASGHIRIDGYLNTISETDYRLTLELKFDDSWHINSYQPLDKTLIPVALSLAAGSGNAEWEIQNIEYPKHELVKLNLSQKPLALYQGHIRIISRLKKNATAEFSPVVNLQLQACNDRICLPPENIVLTPRLIPQ